MSKIVNASNIPLNQQFSSVPDVSGALQGYFQPMVFTPLLKTVKGYQVVENSNPIEFQGTIQPFTARQLYLKPEGQRAWSWFTVHAEPGVVLKVDDVILYIDKQYRVMSKKNFTLYGYDEYELITDWNNSGP